MTVFRKSFIVGLVLAGGLAVVANPESVWAHHGGGVEYFMDQRMGPITGTVTRFAFVFPHVQVYFDVTDESGAVQHWAGVFQLTPTRLRARGWTRDTIKPGDTLTITYSPHRTAPHVGFVRRLELNGEFLDEGV